MPARDCGRTLVTSHPRQHPASSCVSELCDGLERGGDGVLSVRVWHRLLWMGRRAQVQQAVPRGNVLLAKFCVVVVPFGAVSTRR